MNDEILLRYSRHLLLKEVGIEGQTRLAEGRVLVLGCGGLGATVVPFLAAAGVGRLLLADHDVVELSNLQRQIAYRETDLGRPKVEAATDAVRALNPAVQVQALRERLDEPTLTALARTVDVLVDCSDNYATRRALNRAALAARVPLVSGAAVRFEGQLSVYLPHDPASPCYECLFPGEEAGDGPCATFGVFAPLVGVVGAHQAAETLKLLMGVGRPPVGRLLSYDALEACWREMGFERDPACPACWQPGAAAPSA